jgi:hypothetical protein
MPLPRLGLCLCFALAGVTASAATARAEPPADAPARDRSASIVLIGAAGRDLELKALLGELLERRGVQARISEQEAFGREQLLRSEGRGDGVLVFVVPGVGGNVRLYFRAPDGEHFLLRSVLLRAGFDDVGRELVGQVVETAVASLLDSGDGLTREQAQQALTNEEAATTPATPDEPKTPGLRRPPPVTPRAPPASARSRPTAVEGWLGLRYGAVALGTELGVAHGPGLELGLGVTRGYLLRGRLLFERDFPQSFSTQLIAAELTRWRLRFAVDAGLELTRRQLLLVSLGVGQDRLDVTPTSAPGSSVAPRAAFRDQAPVALAELRYEGVLGRFRVAASLGADISLVQTHYDVAHPTERESVVSPWSVRPSAGLALAYCPRLTTF